MTDDCTVVKHFQDVLLQKDSCSCLGGDSGGQERCSNIVADALSLSSDT